MGGELLGRVERGVGSLQIVPAGTDQRREPGAPDPTLVVESPQMRALYALAGRAATSTSNILILGETGVGKEVLAESIHRSSPRASGPFFALNCAALPESLVDAELFGYERGAFTGAAQTKPGVLEAASGGTVFLDEVGDMPLLMQAKLLRAIASRQVLRLGALKTRPIDVRFIAATNCDMAAQVAEKSFREDLYFRLNVICLKIPPLRARAEEIEPLALGFLQALAPPGRTIPRLSPEALALMQAYAWPGNVRELRNAMERALVYCPDATIAPEHLSLQPAQRGEGPRVGATDRAAPGHERWSMLQRLERDAILEALDRAHGNQTRAARMMGMPRRTFCARLVAYDIPRPRAIARSGPGGPDEERLPRLQAPSP